MAKAKLVLHTKVYSDGNSPIMLRVTHQRKSKYIALGINCKPKQWNKDSRRLRKNYEGYIKRNKVLKSLETRAGDIIDTLVKDNMPFTFSIFEERFRNEAKTTTVFDFIEDICNKLKRDEKVNTYNVYKQTLNALRDFHKKSNLMFPDIDYNFLKGFESFLFRRGCSGGGVHFYMRTLRAVLNEAIKQGYLKQDYYPFSTQFNKNGYSLQDLKSKANPRALSDVDMDKLKNFPVEEHPDLKTSLYYFLFSYYARGMNFIDMAKLERNNIYDGRITYFRSKTKKPLSIAISPPMKTIIKEIGNTSTHYVFPILDEKVHIRESQIKNRVKKCLKKVNADLKEVGNLVGISIPLTTYVARHTYATTLKRSGVDTAIISEGLGHSDISTTRAYLKKFDHQTIDEADKLL